MTGRLSHQGVAVLGLSLLCLLTGGAQRASCYAFTQCLGEEGTGPGQFRYPGGVAVDGQGSIYVSDTNNHRIVKLGPAGEYQSAWGPIGRYDSRLVMPMLVTIAGDRLYVADFGDFRVAAYDLTGKLVASIPCKGRAIGSVAVVGIVAAARHDDLTYACNVAGVVQVFDGKGRLIRRIGRPGRGQGEFRAPSGLAVDPDGNLYVADRGNDRIQVFDRQGKWQLQFGTTGSGDGQFRGPCGVALDPEGNVLVTDAGNHRVQRFTRRGTFLGAFGCYGKRNGEFRGPAGIAVDTQGNTYVVDTGNHRVQKFAPDASRKALPAVSQPGKEDYSWAQGVHQAGHLFRSLQKLERQLQELVAESDARNPPGLYCAVLDPETGYEYRADVGLRKADLGIEGPDGMIRFKDGQTLPAPGG